ncbi:MAG: GatB/YqeY domain-containing protein [bacterium]|nr:GatB/YqeY domain-containing protein [bacterium]
MKLHEQILADFKESMKSREEVRLSTLRLLRSELKNKEIEKQTELTEDDMLAVIKTMVKQYKEALEQFKSGGREDLVEKQKKEIEILEAYLPAQMPDEEIETIIREVLNEAGEGAGDIGKMMGAVMKKVAGRADGNRVRTLVQKMVQ